MNLPMISVLHKSALARVTEKEFQDAVVHFARERGWLIHFTHYATTQLKSGKWVGTAQAGWPDIYGCRGTHSIAWELKTESGSVRPEQKEWLAALEETGVQTGVYRPRDSEELMRRLR